MVKASRNASLKGTHAMNLRSRPTTHTTLKTPKRKRLTPAGPRTASPDAFAAEFGSPPQSTPKSAARSAPQSPAPQTPANLQPIQLTFEQGPSQTDERSFSRGDISGVEYDPLHHWRPSGHTFMKRPRKPRKKYYRKKR